MSNNVEGLEYYEIHDLLCASVGGHEVILVLRAYFDESGKLKDTHETASAIGGCIASAEQWTLFESKWAATLKFPDFKVSQLHMNNLESSTGEFAGWSQGKKEDFIDRLLKIMEEHCLKYLGAVVPLEQFKALDQASKMRLHDPYFVCLEDAILFAAETAKKLFDPPEYVEIMCDREERFRAKVLKVYDACETDYRVGDRLASIGFGRMDRILPLQAADLIAYELLRVGRMIADQSENPIDNPRPTLARLIAKKHNLFKFTYPLEDLSKRVSPNYTS